jgi:hypothetical protein
MDRTHASADIEDRLPIDPALGEPIDQRSRQTTGAIAMVGAKLLIGVPSVELTIERGVTRRATVHAPMLAAPGQPSRERTTTL